MTYDRSILIVLSESAGAHKSSESTQTAFRSKGSPLLKPCDTNVRLPYHILGREFQSSIALLSDRSHMHRDPTIDNTGQHKEGKFVLMASPILH